MAFFQDNFTGSNGTQLQSHTPDLGTSWTRLYGSTAALDWVINASNQITPEVSTDNGVIYTADASYPSANYFIEWTLVAQTTSTVRPTYGLVRVQDVDNLYAVLLVGGTNTCSLYKKVSGTWTALGSAFSKPADGSVCKLEINGTTLTFYDDGVSLASATDSDISAAGKAGIAAGGGGELVDSTHDSTNANIWDSFSVIEVASGITQAVGQVSETDSAQPMGRVKVRGVGQNVETDSSLALVRSKTRALAFVSETETTLPITASKRLAIGLASETESALPLGTSITVVVGLATETNAPFALAILKTRGVGLINETDAVFSLAARKSRNLELVSESDAPFAIGRAKALSLGLASEVGSALALGTRITVAIGLVTEAETLFGLTALKTRAVGLVSESDALFPLGRAKTLSLGLVTEADAALTIMLFGVAVSIYTVALFSNPTPAARLRTNPTPGDALDSNPFPSVSLLSG